MPAGPFNVIQNDWYNPPPGRNQALMLDVLDAMADMERAVLGFLDPTNGLQYSYGGSNLPEALPPGKYPVVLHLPSGKGKMQSLTTMGANLLIAHPGGIRQHRMPFEIYWLVGNRAENIKRLMVESQFWCKAVDQAYAANGTLGGLVKQVGLSGFHWGGIDYGVGQKMQTYFGWVFEGEALIQYTMQGG